MFNIIHQGGGNHLKSVVKIEFSKYPLFAGVTPPPPDLNPREPTKANWNCGSRAGEAAVLSIISWYRVLNQITHIVVMKVRLAL